MQLNDSNEKKKIILKINCILKISILRNKINGNLVDFKNKETTDMPFLKNILLNMEN